MRWTGRTTTATIITIVERFLKVRAKARSIMPGV
jgi:hypothetical protein